LTHVLTTTLHHHFGRKGRRSSNGTEIAGRVQGDGPPVVFVSSAAGDGDTSWAALMPYVTDRLTWFLLCTRGRGLSQDAEDHSCGRLVEDVTAFVDSIGEPVGLVGHSSGAMLSLAAAAASDAVGAVAAYEPGVAGLVDEATAAQAQAAAERALETGSDGRRGPTLLRGLSAVQRRGSGAPVGVRGVRAHGALLPGVGAGATEYLRAVDASAIERISAPVLLLHGPRTHRFFTDSVHHLAAELADARLAEIPDVGHMGPGMAPEPVAGELVPFFQSALAER
jgi:pimeloyl-ACP methyl ester carboxylesterase